MMIGRREPCYDNQKLLALLFNILRAIIDKYHYQ